MPSWISDRKMHVYLGAQPKTHNAQHNVNTKVYRCAEHIRDAKKNHRKPRTSSSSSSTPESVFSIRSFTADTVLPIAFLWCRWMLLLLLLLFYSSFLLIFGVVSHARSVASHITYLERCAKHMRVYQVPLDIRSISTGSNTAQHLAPN